jgi:hypothetical protein
MMNADIRDNIVKQTPLAPAGKVSTRFFTGYFIKINPDNAEILQVEFPPCTRKESGAMQGMPPSLHPGLHTFAS